MYLYNTASGEKEEFQPLQAKVVKMYNCGPTVYAKQHIGNLSMFVFADVLRKTLEYNGYAVKQVINFTDVGHLVSDGDEGEDKMTKGLKASGKALTIENMLALGEKYGKLFLDDLETLNVETKSVEFPRASAYIPSQIAMVRTLEEKGYAYAGKDGVYYDTSKFDRYGKLGNINLEGLKEGARVHAASDKRNPTDFLLWKFDTKLGWDSPWGKGFPGWHIECSAMARSILGEQIDIHTGGIEHIPVHHNNEIAQSEAVTGKVPFARYWLHRAHIQIESSKISKSLGNTVFLSDIQKKHLHPLALRYLYLTAHYRSSSNFTWDALKAAQQTLMRLVRAGTKTTEDSTVPTAYRTRFLAYINDDLDTPGALALISEMLKDDALSDADKRAGLADFDQVLGLNLTNPDEAMQKLLAKEYGINVEHTELPANVQKYVSEREAARAGKDWAFADELRKKIEEAGYELKDTADGPQVVQKG